MTMLCSQGMPDGIGKEIFRQSGHLSMMHDWALRTFLQSV
jgi:hypothetical protein